MERTATGRVRNQSALVLVSGGLDSMACLHILRSQGFHISGLYVDYGQPSARFEKAAAETVAGKLKVILQQARLASDRKFGSGELVGRNWMLLSVALFLANPRPNAIAIGVHQGGPYYDCSPHFIAKTRELIQEHTEGATTLVAPFVEWEKTDIFAYIRKSRLPFEATYSCEAGRKDGCGSCLSCMDRVALIAG